MRVAKCLRDGWEGSEPDLTDHVDKAHRQEYSTLNEFKEWLRRNTKVEEITLIGTASEEKVEWGK